MKKIISILDLSKGEIEYILELASKESIIEQKYSKVFNNKILGSLFFQPSTRTQLSMQAAFVKLGGTQIGFSNIEESRSGETYHEDYSDLARMIENYCDIVIMRTMQDIEFYEFCNTIKIPVISAGHGNIEHPTQCLVDLYAIKKLIKRLDNINILFIGTPPSRAMNSLILALSYYSNISINIICNENIKVDISISKYYNDGCIRYFSDINEYWQKENYFNLDIIYVAEIKNADNNSNYTLQAKHLKSLGQHTHILCPLPRTDQLPKYIDDYPNSKYFIQARDALYVRQALYIALLHTNFK